MIKVDLVGGPCDGEWALAKEGDLFVYVRRRGKDHVYGLGDDDRYYHCPRISEAE